MFLENLRNELNQRAKLAAVSRDVDFIETKTGVIVLRNVKHNFTRKVAESIRENSEWQKRLNKPHTHFAASEKINELASCNSSDALLMNIFCYPGVEQWSFFKKCFRIKSEYNPVFGWKAGVKKQGKNDQTEVDMLLNEFIIEAKLTEDNFQAKSKRVVEQYDFFEETFYSDSLPQSPDHTKYTTYQVIRNILAAQQYDRHFRLICDTRRGDLIRDFYLTVSCVKDIELRKRCDLVLWQELCEHAGKHLKNYLRIKYGL